MITRILSNRFHPHKNCLSTRNLTFCNGGNTAKFCSIPPMKTAAIAAIFAVTVGLNVEAIVVSASHSHSTPFCKPLERPTASYANGVRNPLPPCSQALAFHPDRPLLHGGLPLRFTAVPLAFPRSHPYRRFSRSKKFPSSKTGDADVSRYQYPFYHEIRL